MSKEETSNILIIGIGNSGRKDDGLGWLMLDFIKKKFFNIDCLYRYQLQIEDAEILSHYPTVVFVDATRENTENGFFFRSCHPNKGFGLSSHILEPETVLWLEDKLYHKNPMAYALGIEGKEWDLSLDPSEAGLHNLSKAQDFLKNNIHLIIKNKASSILQKQ